MLTRPRHYSMKVNPAGRRGLWRNCWRQGKLKAADVCLQTHGGFGFIEEYDIERKFRETRLCKSLPSVQI